MRRLTLGIILRLYGCAFLSFVATSHCLSAQQTKPSSTLQATLATFGTTAPTAVVLQGDIEFSRGNTTEKGRVTLTASSDGGFRYEADLPSGKRSEAYGDQKGRRTCTTSDGEKIINRLSANCWQTAPWFFPQMALLDNSGKLASIEDRGIVTDKQGARQVLGISRTSSLTFKNAADAKLIVEWSGSTLSLDPVTQLPARLEYVLRAESRTDIKIPVRVIYSEYWPQDGVQIAHHIQRYINGTLQADIRIDSVSIK